MTTRDEICLYLLTIMLQAWARRSSGKAASKCHRSVIPALAVRQCMSNMISRPRFAASETRKSML